MHAYSGGGGWGGGGCITTHNISFSFHLIQGLIKSLGKVFTKDVKPIHSIHQRRSNKI